MKGINSSEPSFLFLFYFSIHGVSGIRRLIEQAESGEINDKRLSHISVCICFGIGGVSEMFWERGIKNEKEMNVSILSLIASDILVLATEIASLHFITLRRA